MKTTLLEKMKANKDVSTKKNSNHQLWSKAMLEVAVKKGQLSKVDFDKIVK